MNCGACHTEVKNGIKRKCNVYDHAQNKFVVVEIELCEKCASSKSLQLEECAECKREFVAATTVTVYIGGRKKRVCLECYENMLSSGRLKQCSECGVVSESGISDVSSVSKKYKFLCEKCKSKLSQTCKECGSVSYDGMCKYSGFNELGVHVESAVCIVCYESALSRMSPRGLHLTGCAECGITWDAKFCKEIVIDGNKRFLCPKCHAKIGKIVCKNCGGFVRKENRVRIDDAGNVMCGFCYGGCINNYHHKPTKQNTLDFSKGPLYGFEIETTAYPGGAVLAGRALHRFSDYGKNFWLKHDSSIRYREEDGIEIVTRPITIEEMMAPNNMFDVIDEQVTKLGGLSHQAGCCGVHIHRSVADVNSDDRAILIKFFELCQPQLEAIAARVSDYAKFDGVRQKCNGVQKVCMLKEVVKKNPSVGRGALHFTDHTIEVRLFKGTTNPSILYAYAGAVHFAFAFSKYVNSLPTENQEMIMVGKAPCWKAFTRFVKDSSLKETSEGALARILLNYMIQKGVCK